MRDKERLYDLIKIAVGLKINLDDIGVNIEKLDEELSNLNNEDGEKIDILEDQIKKIIDMRKNERSDK